ncbi:alpha/beta hydrolase family protein [Nakamurella sp. GG22]
MKLYFDDQNFDGQLQRSVGKADSGMANVGECLAIAAQIAPGDRDSWYRAWSTFGLRLVEQADSAVASGHRVSARAAYLRAAEYLRQAFFFHREDLDGKELRSAYAASVAAFRSALPLLDHRAEVLTGSVSGYLFTPSGATGPLPTLLHVGGYDGTAEELYASVYPALERGYAFAAIDGPGQGAMLYDQRIPMRPDWENVVPGMVDALLAQPEVDPRRLVLVGRSFGGLIAPRGASAEHRLAALVVDPGQYDMGAAVVVRLGALAQRLDDPAADPTFQGLLENPEMATLLAPRMVTNGTPTVRGYFKDMTRYHNRDTAAKISCPTYVTDNETDHVSTGQGQQLFDHLTCPKQFRRFTVAEGAAGHCEGMAPIVYWTAAFDWLDGVLAG